MVLYLGSCIDFQTNEMSQHFTECTADVLWMWSVWLGSLRKRYFTTLGRQWLEIEDPRAGGSSRQRGIKSLL